MNLKHVVVMLLALGFSFPLIGMRSRSALPVQNMESLCDDQYFHKLETGSQFVVANRSTFEVTGKHQGISVVTDRGSQVQSQERSLNFAGPVPSVTFWNIPLMWQRCSVKKSCKVSCGSLREDNRIQAEGVASSFNFHRDPYVTKAGWTVIGGTLAALAGATYWLGLWGNK